MFNLQSEIYKKKVVRLVFRVTQAANLAEGIPVGKAERIGKRQLFLVGDCTGS